ncbi:MAG: hypothetical protein BWX87_02637 [Bacteroidetes bacterium ADurb.Bin123]|nr:MAG: hypothetical protein BWX87_02637 [Bacteroidetes bacterium ADurb.Bin123]
MCPVEYNHVSLKLIVSINENQQIMALMNNASTVFLMHCYI